MVHTDAAPATAADQLTPDLLAQARAETGWTPSRVAVLKALATTGLSTAKIAAQLGGGISRNSVIGKLSRIGLSNGIAATDLRPDQILRRAEGRARSAAALKAREAAHHARAQARAAARTARQAEWEERGGDRTGAGAFAAPPWNDLRQSKPPSMPPQAEYRGGGAPLISLGPCQCRWPVRDPVPGDPMSEFLFCGEATEREFRIDASPYCPEHYMRSISPGARAKHQRRAAVLPLSRKSPGKTVYGQGHGRARV